MKKPNKLYHATYKALIPSIKKEGLGGNFSRKNWSDSKSGVTYWAISPDVAYSYAESSDNVDEDWLDEIVIFECDIRNFDINKLYVDSNVIDDMVDTFEYHDIIPYSKLKIINIYD